MRYTLGSATISAALSLLTASARADDLDKMQGTWKVVYAAASGNVATPGLLKQLTVTVKGRDFTLAEAGSSETITITLNEAERPHKAINFGKGKRPTDNAPYQGIYEFEGPKRLRLSWAPASQPRPQDFNARRTKGHRSFILEK
jgi:uncharacterized protein (TIGR03067 family)